MDYVESLKAYCLICGENTFFDSNVPKDFPCKRNSFICRNCGSAARNRHVAKVILSLYNDTGALCLKDFAKNTELNILNTCMKGAIHEYLKYSKNYAVSEYFDNCKSGQTRNGILCQNLEQTSFEDSSFDMVITEDVLEHVSNPQKACREIKRILKKNGCHIATIPFFENNIKSVTRAVIENGNVRHILEPEYHGDPNRPEGILVFTDFGMDITDKFLSLTGPVKVFASHHDDEDERKYAIFNNWVFVSKNIGNYYFFQPTWNPVERNAMKNEDQLIPYRISDLTGRRVLVLAPHPDDESIGCGGSLILHRMAGDPVKVVCLTNGASGDTKGMTERDSYIKIRQKEVLEACSYLGTGDVIFWPYEDRSLSNSRGVTSRMLEILNTYHPDLVYVPSPLEFHPDHRASVFWLQEAVRQYGADLQVAFCEICHPIRVNCLVDITAVAEKKLSAISSYKSQIRERDYDVITLSLNRFRSLTLPRGVTHAEGFLIWDAQSLRSVGLNAIFFENTDRYIPSAKECGPLVSVIIRTKDRPRLLLNAVRSVIQQTYANVELVVVNDGGEDVEKMVSVMTGNMPFIYIRHEKSKGRSASANAGLKAAGGIYVNFLDDDDILYPDHLETLVSFLSSTGNRVAYTGVRNVYYSGNPLLAENRKREETVFNIDYDPDLLLFENYIPIMSVLFEKDLVTSSGDFCEELDIFEDWDFWIRMSRHTAFHHIDRITAEYRLYDVSCVEDSHRGKYRYDEARAVLFERIVPWLNGKAWLCFLQKGMVARYREDSENLNRQIADLKSADAGHRQHIHDLEESLKKYQMEFSVCQNRVQDREEHMRKLENAIENYRIIEKNLNEVIRNYQGLELRLQNKESYARDLEEAVKNYQGMELRLRDKEIYAQNLEEVLQNYRSIEQNLTEKEKYAQQLEKAVSEYQNVQSGNQAYISELEQITRNFEALLAQKEETVRNLEITCENRNAELEQIRKHPLFRVYRRAAAFSRQQL